MKPTARPLSLGFITLCSVLLICLFLLSPKLSYATETPAPSPATDGKLSEADINQFIDTLNIIKEHYAKTISDKKLLEDATKGMVNNLDPHSEYLNQDAYKDLLTSTSGEFGGLGIQVVSQFGILRIVSPMEGSPAAKAGIKPDDYIVALNDSMVDQMTVDQAVDIMRGKSGTQITLTIIRKGENKPLKFTLTRAIIRTDTIKSKMLESGYGYIRINQFQHSTADLMIKAINELAKQSGGKLKGLILDLRNNPGGLLTTAIRVANNFLESDKLDKYNKLLVYTEGRTDDSQYQAYATGHDILNAAPMIILINQGSASASEIVAGALQDYHRAVIVGETSFGKGSVQTVLPLDETHAIKITTALYHSPSGRLIQNQGITPDIPLSALKVTDANDPVFIDSIREFQLKDHLKNQTAADNALPDNNKELASLAQDDFQVYESLNILKTMSLLQNKAHPILNPKP